MKILSISIVLIIITLLLATTFDGLPALKGAFNSDVLKAVLVALVGAAATYSTRRFMANDAVFKKEMSTTFELFTKDLMNSFHVFQLENEQSHQQLKNSVDDVKVMAHTIKSDVDHVKHINNSKLRYRKDFQDAIKSNLRFLKMTSELQEFSIIKCNAFFDFVMDVHSLGFETDIIDIDVLKSTGFSISNQVKEKGYSFLGYQFIEAFYTLHVEKVDLYFCAIEDLLKEDCADKHERFQNISIEFMNEFCEMLFKFYMANGGKTNEIS